MYNLQGEQYDSCLKTKFPAKLLSVGSIFCVSFVINIDTI